MEQKTKTPIFYILGIVFIWRAVLWLFGFVAKNRFDLLPDPSYGKILPWNAPTHSLLALWARWDSGFYLEIAKSGYFFDQAKGFYNTIFFPLYPMLIGAFSFIFNNSLVSSGIILSFIFTILACIFLYKLARLDLEDETAKRSIFYFLIFPAAIFLAAVYNESLFVFLACASFYFARKNKWLIAGAFGFFAALTRPQGILLLPVLFLEYLEQREFSLKKLRLNILNLLWIPAGLITFMYYLHKKFGNAFLFFTQQSLFDRQTNLFFSNLLQTLKKYLTGFFFPHQDFFPEYLNRDIEFIFFAAFLILAIWIFFSFRMSYGFYILLGLLFPLLTGILTSIQRYTILLFPVFIFLAKLGRKQSINFAVTLIFSIFLGLFTILFINWYWAG
ncbi:MAG: mannosyltransferase family protein [Patescibacteria group bacterium]